jgi:hypothetical protein
MSECVHTPFLHVCILAPGVCVKHVSMSPCLSLCHCSPRVDSPPVVLTAFTNVWRDTRKMMSQTDRDTPLPEVPKVLLGGGEREREGEIRSHSFHLKFNILRMFFYTFIGYGYRLNSVLPG